MDDEKLAFNLKTGTDRIESRIYPNIIKIRKRLSQRSFILSMACGITNQTILSFTFAEKVLVREILDPIRPTGLHSQSSLEPTKSTRLGQLGCLTSDHSPRVLARWACTIHSNSWSEQ